MLTRLVANLDRRSRRWIGALSARGGASLAVLIMVAGICYLPGLTVAPALDRTEGVVALSSRHVIESGNPFDPRWGDNLQVFRPAGTFWVQAGAVALQGEARRTEVGAFRVPSFLATLLAVALLFLLGRGLFGAEAAFMAALAVGVTPIVALHAQLAIAEPLVLPFVVVSQLALFAITRRGRDDPEPRWLGWLGAFWVSLGVSTWFNALGVFFLAAVTLVGLVIAERRLAPVVRLKAWLGLPLLGLAALPWLIALNEIGGGAAFAGLDWRTVLDRLEGGQEMKFKTVYGVFVLFVVLGFIPVAHMLGPALARAWPARGDRAVRFLLAWLIAPVAALEILSNKPPLYTVQAVFPAGALLVALAVTGRLGGHRAFRSWPGFFTGTSLFVAIVVPALVAGLLWFTDTRPTAAVVIGAILIIALFAVAGWAAAQGRGHAWFTSAIAATVTLNLWFFGALMPGLQNTWTAPQIRAAVDAIKACGGSDVVVTGFNEPSLPLALGNDASVLAPAAAGARFAKGDDRQWAIVEERRRAVFRTASGDKAVSVRGCIRSINIARGCLNRFEVLSPSDPGDESKATCARAVAPACRPAPQTRFWFDIKHCR